MTVLGPALGLSPEPTSDDNCDGDDGNDKDCRGPCGETCPLNINQGKSPGILLDFVGRGLVSHVLGHLLPVEPVEAAEFPQLVDFIIGGTHFWTEIFSFILSERRGTKLD